MKVTLEQWQALLAVVDEGGYAKAAEALDKSQSAVSYAIQQLEEKLGVRVFELQGRRAGLTASGKLLYRRASQLLNSAQALEAAAAELSSDWQAEIALAVDVIFPDELLFQALAEFGEMHPLTRINLQETVLSGGNEALIKRDVSLAITGDIVPGFVGDLLLEQRFVAVAAPSHPLHQLNRSIDVDELRQHRQLVIRDSGSRGLDAGWLGAEQRWTFSHPTTSVKAAVAGLGYAWYPKRMIDEHLQSGALVALPLATGSERNASLYLIYAEGDQASPCCRALGELLKQVCAP